MIPNRTFAALVVLLSALVGSSVLGGVMAPSATAQSSADSQGGLVSNYAGTPITLPDEIVTGPDGALWFANFGNNSIGRITTDGVITEYTDPSIGDPDEIVVGPDGALWFTNYGNNSIGRITVAGVVSNYTGTGIDKPQGITVGPDGALWFTNGGNNSIGRITTSGVVTSYPNSRKSHDRRPRTDRYRPGRIVVVHRRDKERDLAEHNCWGDDLLHR